MNIYLKLLFVIFAVNMHSGCAWSSEKNVSISDPRANQCEEVKYGELNLSLLVNSEPSYNSYLLNCAVSVVVPFPEEKDISVKKRGKKKLAAADYFMSQDLDVDYRDETGSTLLMSVIVSYMPSEWKVKAVKILIAKGCNIHARNNYGKTAIDLAEFAEESEIIKVLSACSE